MSERIIYFRRAALMADKKKLVPEAESALDKLKYEVADEEGIRLKDGYNGDIRAKDAGKIGGNMVKKMIRFAEKNMKDSK
jgi:hypothetical protein